jgi:hypothetical protein
VLKAHWGDCSWPTWASSGHVGVQRGRMMACTASPCDATEHLQKHVGDGPPGGLGTSVAAFLAKVRRQLMWKGGAFGRAVSSRC